MSDQPLSPPKTVAEIAAALPKQDRLATEGLDVKHLEESTEKMVDAIEMIGEEQAANFPTHSQVTAGMRYLHCSRTIHQLVTDRNRAVGLFFAAASLLLTASAALFNADPKGDLIIPKDVIQRWCLPITFGTLTVMAILVAFLLIRTRVGLIYEAAKMNVLLGLPVGRVQRTNPLSIFFIMQVIISLAGGGSAGIFSIFMMMLADRHMEHVAVFAAIVGALVTAGLILLYILSVNHVTSDKRLQQIGK